jgi:hypothetical protein
MQESIDKLDSQIRSLKREYEKGDARTFMDFSPSLSICLKMTAPRSQHLELTARRLYNTNVMGVISRGFFVRRKRSGKRGRKAHLESVLDKAAGLFHESDLNDGLCDPGRVPAGSSTSSNEDQLGLSIETVCCSQRTRS